MPPISEAFQNFPWMMQVFIIGGAFYAMLIVQYVKGNRANYMPILLGLLFMLFLSGPFGTVTGLYQVGEGIIRIREVEAMSQRMLKFGGDGFHSMRSPS
jgi:hypothetical protein